MSDPSSKSLSLAVCLYPGLTLLDIQGPIESPIVYLADALEPIKPGYTGEGGPRLLPDATYAEATQQYDIVLLGGGVTGTPDEVPKSLLDFLKRQMSGVTYVLTVCTGSWILSATGALDGRRATTNKDYFKRTVEATGSHNIDWVAKARWVVDGKFWTSSGVSAGMDMANAFVKHLAGPDIAHIIANVIEMRARGADEDEFAEVHGLV
ncbi:class I glutamine amidotransferase-like protein [Schizophyllum commune]